MGFLISIQSTNNTFKNAPPALTIGAFKVNYLSKSLTTNHPRVGSSLLTASAEGNDVASPRFHSPCLYRLCKTGA